MKSKLLLKNHLLLKVPLLLLLRKLDPQSQRTMVVFNLQFHWQVLQQQMHLFNHNLATFLLHLRPNQLQQA
jgi:hypothetical protein